MQTWDLDLAVENWAPWQLAIGPYTTTDLNNASYSSSAVGWEYNKRTGRKWRIETQVGGVWVDGDSVEVIAPGLNNKPSSLFLYLSANPIGPTHKTVHGSTNVVSNPGPLTETYRLSVDYATGEDFSQEITLGPGENFTLVVDDDRSHSVNIERQREIGDNVGSYWESVGGGASTGRDEPVEYTPAGHEETPGENDFWIGSGSSPFPGQPPIVVVPESRSALASSDAAEQISTADENAEARHAEILSVLQQANDRAAQRSQAEASAVIASVERLRLSNRDSIQGLMEEGGDAAQIEEGLLGSVVSEPGTGTLLSDVWPDLDVPAVDSPSVTIPLAAVGTLAGLSISDVEIVVDLETYPWLSTVRAFLVTCLGVLFLLSIARLLGSLVGIQGTT
jgi:hypothetical protein